MKKAQKKINIST